MLTKNYDIKTINTRDLYTVYIHQFNINCLKHNNNI